MSDTHSLEKHLTVFYVQGYNPCPHGAYIQVGDIGLDLLSLNTWA